MSKPFRPFYSALLASILCLQTFTSAWGQALHADVKVDKSSALEVTGRVRRSAGDPFLTNLSFLQSVASADKLAERLSSIAVWDVDRKPLNLKKLLSGEYVADGAIDSFRYSIDLSPPARTTALAHASWYSGDVGILMLRDLLPRRIDLRGWITSVDLETPEDWKILSTDSMQRGKRAESLLMTSDAEDTIILVGSGWRAYTLKSGGADVTLGVSKEWHFSDQQAADFVAEIYGRYSRIIGDNSGRRLVAITRFPGQVESGSWESETIGRSVVLLSSDMPFKTQSLQRLHEQLRHELFHMWIPNGVNLTGNYDWFYEGFALYQSLRLAVSMNRIRFEDFLDTLSRAHTVDSAGSQRVSLINASKSRFNGSNTQVYARGMLVAFLTDLAMLERSKGKRSIEDLLREFYAKHQNSNTAVDGNAAALESLKSNAGEAIVSKYVSGTDKIDWTKELALAGVSDSDPGIITTLRVNEKLSGRQKTLLDKLGYNNWRKLSPGSK